jgi:hypothetical protein
MPPFLQLLGAFERRRLPSAGGVSGIIPLSQKGVDKSMNKLKGRNKIGLLKSVPFHSVRMRLQMTAAASEFQAW